MIEKSTRTLQVQRVKDSTNTQCIAYKSACDGHKKNCFDTKNAYKFWGNTP